MPQLEVLICKLLSIDALATSAVASREVTTLKHELRDDTVELAASIAKALLTGAKSTEVLSSLGDNVVEEIEVDATGLLLDLAYVCHLALVRDCELRAFPADGVASVVHFYS